MIPEGKFKDFVRYARRAILSRRSFPAVGKVDLGDLDRVTPVSDNWGFDRGAPVDRLFIENFITDFKSDIHGRVLEVADNSYTVQFGRERVAQSDILHNAPGHDRATLVLDLTNTGEAPADRFDCIICTQTLHLIYDIGAAIETLHKMLKPGGVLLLTAPAITAISRWDMEQHGDHWRFTSATLVRLFEAQFGAANLTLKSYGNVYAATAFLHGLAVEELDQKKLSFFDPDYEILNALRAVKPSDGE